MPSGQSFLDTLYTKAGKGITIKTPKQVEVSLPNCQIKMGHSYQNTKAGRGIATKGKIRKGHCYQNKRTGREITTKTLKLEGALLPKFQR
jgi:hypothetical protein